MLPLSLSRRGANDVVSLRIYKGKAIVAPGAEYKSVVAHAGSTARKVRGARIEGKAAMGQND